MTGSCAGLRAATSAGPSKSLEAARRDNGGTIGTLTPWEIALFSALFAARASLQFRHFTSKGPVQASRARTQADAVSIENVVSR